MRIFPFDPSPAMTAVLLSMHLCFHVDLYGFAAPLKEHPPPSSQWGFDGRTAYWESGPPPRGAKDESPDPRELETLVRKSRDEVVRDYAIGMLVPLFVSEPSTKRLEPPSSAATRQCSSCTVGHGRRYGLSVWAGSPSGV